MPLIIKHTEARSQAVMVGTITLARLRASTGTSAGLYTLLFAPMLIAPSDTRGGVGGDVSTASHA